jgi:hypothetical protein
MATILIVQTDGNIKENTVKQFVEEDLYKKAGFRTREGFTLHATWSLDNVNNKKYNLFVYGKTDGRANQENKYEFPPPIDNTLFFGSCIIINKIGDTLVDLTEPEWNVIYEKLYGGFDDVNSEDESDSESDDDVPRTKSGYVKDGFIVDDEEEEEEEEDEEEVEEEEDEEDDDIPKKKARKPKNVKKSIIKLKTKPKPPRVPVIAFTEAETELDCTNELCEEEYVIE